MRLTEEFYNKHIGKSIARNNSNNTSIKGKNKALNLLCEYITSNHYQLKDKDQTSTKENGTTLTKKKKEDKSKAIKEADKGNTVVLMSKKDYKHLILSL